MAQSQDAGQSSAADRPEVEVAHEALIRRWPRLRSWLAEDRAGLRLRQELGEAARAWEGTDCDKNWLEHRGARLAAAEE